VSQSALDRYARLFASLTPATLDALCEQVTEEVHFRDPFNDIHGRDAFRHLLQDMFARSACPSFTVVEACWHDASEIGWLRWHFNAELPVIGRLSVEGCSRILLDEAGRVREHLDYWDSAPVYLQLPLIGSVLRRIQRRVSSQT